MFSMACELAHWRSAVTRAPNPCLVQVKQMLQTEQKRADYRPSEEFPPPLDQATEACCLVSSLFAAVLKEASQTLQASNLVSFNAEASLLRLLLHLANLGMIPDTLLMTGNLGWRRGLLY